MTRENKTTIQPQDIVSAEFECLSCHVIITIPVKGFVEPRFSCPHCNQQWFPNRGGKSQSAVHRVVDGIREYQEAVKNKDITMGVSVRFLLADEKTLAADLSGDLGER